MGGWLDLRRPVHVGSNIIHFLFVVLTWTGRRMIAWADGPGSHMTPTTVFVLVVSCVEFGRPHSSCLIRVVLIV